eukprot:179699-Rhodomonas_salina.2
MSLFTQTGQQPSIGIAKSIQGAWANLVCRGEQQDSLKSKAERRAELIRGRNQEEKERLLSREGISKEVTPPEGEPGSPQTKVSSTSSAHPDACGCASVARPDPERFSSCKMMMRAIEKVCAGVLCVLKFPSKQDTSVAVPVTRATSQPGAAGDRSIVQSR